MIGAGLGVVEDTPLRVRRAPGEAFVAVSVRRPLAPVDVEIHVAGTPGELDGHRSRAGRRKLHREEQFDPGGG